MKNEIVNKHDAVFKEVFSQKRIAKDFIENNIPKEALDIIDTNSMELIKDTFINKELQGSFSDLIYEVKINNRDAYICFLLEHKSYRDKLTIFPLNKYILEAWTAVIQKENREELPIILPIVVYHGEKEWSIKTDLRDMIPEFYELPEYFKDRIPVFGYDLINMGKSGRIDFKKFNKLTALMLTAFRDAFEKDLKTVLREFLLAVEEAEKEEGEEAIRYYVEIYIRYIENIHRDLTEEDIEGEIEKLGGKGAVTMSILQKREEKGKQEGKREGKREGRQEGIKEIAKNLLKEGIEIAFVAKTTGLSKSEVEKLKEEI